MKLKSKCFIGLGGAGRNALVSFIEKEENAEFFLFDTESTCEDDLILEYEGKYSEQIVDLENLDAITNQFSKDKSYVLLASLSYSEFRKKASTALVKHIASYFSKNNYDFKIVLTTPVIFEYNAEHHLIINEIKLEIESLGDTIIVNLDEYLKKYGDFGLSYFAKFHYIAWKHNINKFKSN
ncbi:hypothetical protein EC396_04220 [Lutibacter sp. HS1-25]|uniref:hypothetical protein n=1 Tax=Lutibacter sp. HS1-25 TaxID=2485000 RepID=UPI001013135F|nr:hypothetical protein [Lutibacter sp. HS1-25]RXP60867.1 hypothetical protein EC396_04220 [Lutibacter sp. HS1-25]